MASRAVPEEASGLQVVEQSGLEVVPSPDNTAPEVVQSYQDPAGVTTTASPFDYKTWEKERGVANSTPSAISPNYSSTAGSPYPSHAGLTSGPGSPAPVAAAAVGAGGVGGAAATPAVENATPSKGRRKLLPIILGVCAVVVVLAIALGVGLGVGLKNHNKKASSAEATATAAGAGASSTAGLLTTATATTITTTASASATTTTSSSSAAGYTTAGNVIPAATATASFSTSDADISCPSDNLTLYTDTNDDKKFLLLCGLDYNSDGGAVDLTSSNASTVADCIRQCAANDTCTAAGWGTYYDVKTCFMKSSIGDPNSSSSWYFIVEESGDNLD